MVHSVPVLWDTSSVSSIGKWPFLAVAEYDAKYFLLQSSYYYYHNARLPVRYGTSTVPILQSVRNDDLKK